MNTSLHYLERLIHETNDVSKRLSETPHCEDTLGEYELTKEKLKASIIAMREGLEAIKGS